MTLAELIASEPANAGRTDAEVLAWLNEGSGQYRERLVNARTIMAELQGVRCYVQQGVDGVHVVMTTADLYP